ncbi:MAG: hypothetical protein AAF645_15210 [Myxococcota bacterium]
MKLQIALVALVTVACGDDAMEMLADAMTDSADAMRDARSSADAMSDDRTVDATMDTPTDAPADGAAAPATTVLESPCDQENVWTSTRTDTIRFGPESETSTRVVETTEFFARFEGVAGRAFVANACGREALNTQPACEDSDIRTDEDRMTRVECDGAPRQETAGAICALTAFSQDGDVVEVECGQVVRTIRSIDGDVFEETEPAGTRFASAKLVVFE